MRINDLLLCFLCACLLSGCNNRQENDSLFEPGKAVGVNKNGRLEEASGLVASIANPGHLWTHNDSGNPAELYLLDEHAVTKKVYSLGKTGNRDWEDIALGPGPEENVNYLYVGDIGDNFARYPVKYIYRIKEPLLSQAEEITDFDTLIVKMSDGMRDAETLMCDPVSKNLYLVSKREDSVRVYEITYPFAEDTLVARKVCILPLKYINGGSISRQGNEILLREYRYLYYWKKTGDESIVDLLKKPAIELQYVPEPQGESIAWANDGSGFFTLGENSKGERAKLLFYKRK